MAGGHKDRTDGGTLPSDALDRVEWTTEAADTTDLARRYDAWAVAYDQDLLQGEDYGTVIDRVVDAMRRHVPSAARVLELGCGTGLVGRALQEEGYAHLDGLDLSPGMLERARRHGAYRSLRTADLNAGIPQPDATCDAVLAVGTLTYLNPLLFHEVCRVLAPGGAFVFTFQPAVHTARGFQDIEDRLLTEERLERLFISDPFPPLPKSMPDVRFCVSVLKRNGVPADGRQAPTAKGLRGTAD